MMTEGTSEHWAGISGLLKNWLDIRAQLQGVRLLTKARIQSASFGCAVPLYNYILLHCLYVPAKLLLCGLLREMSIMDPQANWAFYNYRHLQMQIFSLKAGLGVKYHANADRLERTEGGAQCV